IEQIFAEPPFAAGPRQVPVGRRDQPEVRSQRLLSAHSLEGAVRRARPAVAGLMKRGTSLSTLAMKYLLKIDLSCFDGQPSCPRGGPSDQTERCEGARAVPA